MPSPCRERGMGDKTALRTGAKPRCRAVPRTGGWATRPRREMGAGDEAMSWTWVGQRGRVAGGEQATRPCRGRMRVTRAVSRTGMSDEAALQKGGEDETCRDRADAAVDEPVARPSGCWRW